ncbi:hypothetical protein PHMEG_00017393 [Phytophthora megakarya]|uniref:Reverse transcriptase domain-containing protein n=1 Tax=Phytophthora megakarya TaxID=4795 RepID=A0A225VZ18_9STRA|nr:hypothetical protein PHMEG_00017393 [Phytophthora megakarya]
MRYENSRNDAVNFVKTNMVNAWWVTSEGCARYTIVGTQWMQYGERVCEPIAIDCVEGIGGILLDVVGLWQFELTSVFGEIIRVRACVVDGCDEELLVGLDFMRNNEATLDFKNNEVRFRKDGRAVVIPFRTYASDGDVKVAAVRMVTRVQLGERAVTPIKVAVAANDGEQGVFVPTVYHGAVLLAVTLTTVPAVNASATPARLPSKAELGKWIPLKETMSVLEMRGELQQDKLREWLDSLGDTVTPLENESEVNIGVENSDSRLLMVKLLRAYRKLTNPCGDCLPATAVDVHHRIDTGDEAAIMLKRRRQDQTGEAVVEDNVKKMLVVGVIEEANGGWGFPVVFVRKKDGEVRFCIDYRALNRITKNDVYPLSRIDETLETLSGAIWFTTLDLGAGYWQILVADEVRDTAAFTTS